MAQEPYHDPAYTHLIGQARAETYGNVHPRFPEESAKEDVCVVHVKAGSEHQALLYLLRSVSRHYQLDDVLPEVPEPIASHRYLVHRPPTDLLPEGDAYSCFQSASLPPGFLLTRVPLSSLTPARTRTWGEDTIAEGQGEDLGPEKSHLHSRSAPVTPAPTQQLPAIKDSNSSASRLLRTADKVRLSTTAARGPPAPRQLKAARAIPGAAHTAGTAASQQPATAGNSSDKATPQDIIHQATQPNLPAVAPTALPIFKFLFGDPDPWMQAAAAGSQGRGCPGQDEPYLGPADGQVLGPKPWSEVRIAGMQQRLPVSEKQAKSLRRQIKEKSAKRKQSPLHVLVPVAMPNNPSYLRMASEAIVAFNRRGLMLTPYLDATCVPIAAITTIQSFWRSYKMCRGLNTWENVIELRAATIIQRKWRAYLLCQRLRLLHQMHVLATSLGDLLMASQLALSVACCAVIRDRLARGADRLFPEHCKRFSFDKKAQVYIVVGENDQRPGLPLWVSSLVHTVSQEEAENEHGLQTTFGQEDVLMLLMNGTTWRDPQGNEVSKSKGLPDPPNGSKGSDIVMQISFNSVLEARSRACLLLALTYDPRIAHGAILLPLNTTNIARRMSLPGWSRGATPSFSDLTMHRWSSVHTQLSSAWASRLTSPCQSSEWIHSQVGSLAPSRGSTVRPLAGTSPPRSPFRPLTRDSFARDIFTPQTSQSHHSLSRPPTSDVPDVSRSGLSSPQREPHARSPVHTPLSLSMRAFGSQLPPLYQQRPDSRQMPPLRVPSPQAFSASPQASPQRLSPQLAYPLHLASPPSACAQASTTNSLYGEARTSWQQEDEQKERERIARDSQKLREQQQLLQRQYTMKVQLEQEHQEEAQRRREEAERRAEQERTLSLELKENEALLQEMLLHDKKLQEQMQMQAEQERERQQKMDLEQKVDMEQQVAEAKQRAAEQQALEEKQQKQWARLQELKQQQRDAIKANQEAVPGGPPRSPSSRASANPPGSSLSLLMAMYTVPEEKQEEEGSEGEELRLQMEIESRSQALSDSMKERLKREELMHVNEDGTPWAGVGPPPKKPTIQPPSAAAQAAQTQVHAAGLQIKLRPEGTAEMQHRMGASLEAAMAHKAQEALLLQPLTGRGAQKGHTHHTTRWEASPREDGEPKPLTHTHPALAPRSAWAPCKEQVQWESLPGVFSRKRNGAGGAGAGKSKAALLLELQRKADMLQGLRAAQLENPGLVIEKATIGSYDVAELLETVNITQAMLMREEAFRMQQEAFQERQAAIQNEVRRGHEKAATKLLWVKHTSTSHNLAPSYCPLPGMVMARLVAEMRAVYRAAAMEQVAEARKEHEEAMEEVQEDKERFQHTTNVVGRRQADVLSTLKQVHDESWNKAAKGRSTCRAMAEERRSRRKHERNFSQAFGRQANLLARAVQRGERTVKHSKEAADASQQALEIRMADEARQATIAQNKLDLEALNYHKAAAIRTWEHQQLVQLREAELSGVGKEAVRQRRQEEQARLARLCATGGGVWGGGIPRELLREPLHLSSVVSGAVARRHQKALRQLQQQRQQRRQVPSGQRQRTRTRQQSQGAEAPVQPSDLRQQQPDSQQPSNQHRPLQQPAFDATSDLQPDTSSGCLGAIPEVSQADGEGMESVQHHMQQLATTTLSLDNLLDLDVRPNSAKGGSRPTSGAAAGGHGAPRGPPCTLGTELQQGGIVSGGTSSSRPVSGRGASCSVPPFLPPLPGAIARPSSSQPVPSKREHVNVPPRSPSAHYTARARSAGACTGSLQENSAPSRTQLQSATSGTYTCSTYWTSSGYFTSGSESGRWSGSGSDEGSCYEDVQSGRRGHHQTEMLEGAATDQGDDAGAQSSTEEEEGVVPDLLPELPYAKGAKRFNQRTRPIGIVT